MAQGRRPKLSLACGLGPLALVFWFCQCRNRHEPIALRQIHELHTLRVAADGTEIARFHADDLALLGDEQELIAVGDAGDADNAAVALAGLHVLEADPAA